MLNGHCVKSSPPFMEDSISILQRGQLSLRHIGLPLGSHRWLDEARIKPDLLL